MIRLLTSIIVLMMLAFAGVVQASQCPTTDVIQDPEPFVWTDGGGYFEGTLEIGAASFTFNNGETLTTRAYRQAGGQFSIPGPTMYMTPGQTYVLTFKNTLPFAEPSPEHNTLKDPDISNIHTHGLHVSGDTPADDITRLINGGQCGDYIYEVPGDHMGGLLWYHAHHHGSTWLQVAGGTFGLLLVDDSNDGLPEGVANMTERLLAIGFLEPGRVAGNGGDTLISGTLDSAWTANGLVDGNLCTPVNEWQLWRILIADPDARMKDVEIGPECEMMLLARDGVWRTTAPLALPDNRIELTGASRADLAVRCSADSTLTVDRNVVANIYADGVSTKPNVGPYLDGATGGTWSANRPSYLRDLRFETTLTTPDYTNSISVGAKQVDGHAYDEYIPIFDLLPGVQEWSISATNHPFHLHIYHQQVQGVCDNGAFEDGEYYDTISGSCDIRFDSNPATTSAYSGRTIMHCHILEHEDNGAMGWADALAGDPPPNLELYPGKQVLYECDGCVPTEPIEDTCDDNVDNDCDGFTDCADSDCDADPACQQMDCYQYTSRKDCNKVDGCTWDRDAGSCVFDVCTPAPENCDNGIDDDCDGMTDCADTADCGSDPACQTDCSMYTKEKQCVRNGCDWDGNTNTCIDF